MPERAFFLICTELNQLTVFFLFLNKNILYEYE